MNKAFLREPDALEECCPRCGSQGVRVPEETLQAFLTLHLRRTLGPTAAFCPLATCPVAYFDGLENSLSIEQLGRAIYPKDPTAPLCPCFGLTAEEIELDVSEGGVRRTRAAVERAKSAAAQCLTRSPTGQSCVADIQRYYMKAAGKK